LELHRLIKKRFLRILLDFPRNLASAAKPVLKSRFLTCLAAIEILPLTVKRYEICT